MLVAPLPPQNIDPVYYGFASCTCQRGFTSGGLPPNCVPFPIALTVNASNAGSITDGASTGRLRQGVNTIYTIAPLGSFRVLNLAFNFSASASLEFTAFHGDSPTANPVFFYSSRGLAPAAAAAAPFVLSALSIVGASAQFHYVSGADGGPQFTVAYTTSDACPDGQIFGYSASSATGALSSTGSGASGAAAGAVRVCVPRTAFNVATLTAGAQLAFLIVAAAGIVVSLVSGAAILYHRRHAQLHANTPLASVIIAVGAAITFGMVMPNH
jgi:hypothetical protein